MRVSEILLEAFLYFLRRFHCVIEMLSALHCKTANSNPLSLARNILPRILNGVHLIPRVLSCPGRVTVCNLCPEPITYNNFRLFEQTPLELSRRARNARFDRKKRFQTEKIHVAEKRKTSEARVRLRIAFFLSFPSFPFERSSLLQLLHGFISHRDGKGR